jgi:ligand-binding SRPBCC domain-containing protein
MEGLTYLPAMAGSSPLQLTHHLQRRQFLPITLEEAWAFFSAAANLDKITPPEMGFQIRGMQPALGISEGQQITYTVRPLFGIPLTWVTGITRVEAPHTFTDEQLKGPYALWRHTHSFEPVPGGTVEIDQVEYRMPLGILGELAWSLLVRNRLDQIFDFRQEALQKLFPNR